MNNINPYVEHTFQNNFEKTDLYTQLKKEYNFVNFEKFFEIHWTRIPTPRQQMAQSYINVVPWYYFSFMDTEDSCYDLGCGFNQFKKYFPNLKGVCPNQYDGEFHFGDIQDFVDDDFYRQHCNYYRSLFSINALHYHPLEQLKEICLKFSSMIANNGSGFLTLNYARMLERSDFVNDWVKMPVNEIEFWILSQFENFPCKITVLDVDLTCIDAWLNGNIRIVFSK